MARARYFEVAVDSAGRPVPSATVNVYQAGTVTPIVETIYAADTGATTLTNPLTANAQGEIEFYLAAPKRVDLRWVKAGYTTESHPVDVVDADAWAAHAASGVAHSGAYAATGGVGKPATGTYIRTVANQTTAAVAQSLMTMCPIRITETMTVDRIGTSISVVAASSVIRLGIYSSDSGGLPSALLLDAGTVDTATGTGIKEITISQVLVPGVYWLAAVSQGGAPTASVTTAAGWHVLGYLAATSASTVAGSNPVGLNLAGVTGALPAPTGLVWSGSNAHVVFLRAA